MEQARSEAVCGLKDLVGGWVGREADRHGRMEARQTTRLLIGATTSRKIGEGARISEKWLKGAKV